MRMVGVLLVILNPNYEVLICRKKGDKGWSLPSSTIVQNEGPIFSASRGMKSMFGLKIAYDQLYDTGVKYKISRGKDIDLGQSVFIVNLKEKEVGDLVLTNKVESHWSSRSNLINFLEDGKLKSFVKDLYPLINGYITHNLVDSQARL